MPVLHSVERLTVGLQQRAFLGTVSQLFGDLNNYYEVVFSELIDRREISFEGVDFDFGRWFEVDTISDLRTTEKLFPEMPFAAVLPSVALPSEGRA